MKKHTIKPRFIILIISLSVILISFLIYTVSVGSVYSYDEVTGPTPLNESEFHAQSSDESVVRVVSVRRHSEDAINLLEVTLESVGSGRCEVELTYFDTEINDTTTMTTDIVVLPFGVIYNLTFDSFTGLNAAIYVGVLILLIFVIILSLSFAERIKNGDFSYSMVVIGGVILFLAVNVIFTIIDPMFWTGYGNIVSTKGILAMIMSSGYSFVVLSLIPVFLLAVALVVSNIFLVIKEGFRIQNLLGVVFALLIVAGVTVVYLSEKYYNVETDVLYYFGMIINISSSFLLAYFECMFLSTMICAIASIRYKPPFGMDYLVILGCAIRKDGTPTPILRGRVQRAFDFEQQQYEAVGKHAVFVPSGGQGSDEVISEAESMKRCLMEMGVPEERILKEDQSASTYQNMAFSKKVIEQDAGDLDKVYIGFSTTNYHVFRSGLYARRNKMRAVGMGAKTKWYFWPNAAVREFVGILKEHRGKQALIFGSMIVIYIALTLFVYRA